MYIGFAQTTEKKKRDSIFLFFRGKNCYRLTSFLDYEHEKSFKRKNCLVNKLSLTLMLTLTSTGSQFQIKIVFVPAVNYFEP